MKRKLSKTELKSINGGVQGPCVRYCVPKANYTAECVNGWCVYTYYPPTIE